MARGTQAAKVGLFVVLTGAAAYGIYRYVSPEVAGGGGYTVHAFIRDATGLATRSRVTIAGIPVGTIDSIKLEHGEARLNVKVRPDVALYDNATLGKKSTSLLGEAAVVLTPGTPDHRQLHNGDEIHIIITETTPGDLLDEVKDFADSIKAVAQQLAASVGTEKGGENMRAILGRTSPGSHRVALNKTIRENREVIRETLLEVHEITRNANPEIAHILENVRVVTQEVREMMAEQNPDSEAGQKGELRQTIERLNEASKSLQSTLEHADHVAGRIDRGEGTIGKLTKDEALISEVQGVAEGVNDYVQNISRLQTIVGLRGEYYFPCEHSIKSYVELRLQPSEDKYYLFQLINDQRGLTKTSDTSVQTTNSTGTSPAQYSKTVTYTTTDSLRFSLQFAKRFSRFHRAASE